MGSALNAQVLNKLGFTKAKFLIWDTVKDKNLTTFIWDFVSMFHFLLSERVAVLELADLELAVLEIADLKHRQIFCWYYLA